MKTLLTGIQPTGVITIGNYIGSIKNMVQLQNELEDTNIIVFIADLHSITVPISKSELRKNIRSLAALYIACGLDVNKVKLFIQSEVPAHNQLAYIMECNGYIGELERMTQYKDKKGKQIDGISTSLLTYPCLMAADILLYDANIVPVGIDQKQHLELTRNIAERFNNKFGDTFTIPEPFTVKQGAKIKSLTNPLVKMSKSDENPKSYITLLDDLNITKKRIKSAVTDLDGKIEFDEINKPGISNLLTIYSCLSNKSINDLEKEYTNSGYAKFKEDLADVVESTLKPIQDKYNEIINSSELDEILNKGRDYANYIANRKIEKVYNKIGLGRKR